MRGARADRPRQMSIFSRRASSGWQAISEPRSQVMLLRNAAGRRFIWRVKLSRTASAPLPFILHGTTKRVLRSTSVPTDDRLKAPLSMRSVVPCHRPAHGGSSCPFGLLRRSSAFNRLYSSIAITTTTGRPCLAPQPARRGPSRSAVRSRTSRLSRLGSACDSPTIFYPYLAKLAQNTMDSGLRWIPKKGSQPLAMRRASSASICRSPRRNRELPPAGVEFRRCPLPRWTGFAPGLPAYGIRREEPREEPADRCPIHPPLR